MEEVLNRAGKGVELELDLNSIEFTPLNATYQHYSLLISKADIYDAKE